MITFIIGPEKESMERARQIMSGKRVFASKNAINLDPEAKAIKERDLLFIENLDEKLLFEEIALVIHLLDVQNVETLAITYRDDIIESWEEVEGINIIDLRGDLVE